MNYQFFGRVSAPLPAHPSRAAAPVVRLSTSTDHRRSGLVEPFTQSLLSKQPGPTALLLACSPLGREVAYAG